MKLNEREVVQLMRLQDEIDKEVKGKCRGFVISNRTRQIRLLLNKATRRERELELRKKTEGIQLTLFN